MGCCFSSGASSEVAGSHHHQQTYVPQQSSQEFFDSSQNTIDVVRQQPTCGICLEELEWVGGDTTNATRMCSHRYHIDCLQHYVEAKLEALQLPVKCPFPGCSYGLGHGELMALIRTPELQENYERALMYRYVQSTPGMSFCPTPDCPFVFEWETGKCNEFSCPVCERIYCLLCRRAGHGDDSCDGQPADEDQEAFEKLVKGQGWRRCKVCGVWVDRHSGCNNVTCRCGYQFCYLCETPAGGCKCSPGHAYYSVNAVRDNFARVEVCYCNKVGGVCVCPGH